MSLIDVMKVLRMYKNGRGCLKKTQIVCMREKRMWLFQEKFDKLELYSGPSFMATPEWWDGVILR